MQLSNAGTVFYKGPNSKLTYTQSDFHNQNLIMWTVNPKLNCGQGHKLRSLIPTSSTKYS